MSSSSEPAWLSRPLRRVGIGVLALLQVSVIVIVWGLAKLAASDTRSRAEWRPPANSEGVSTAVAFPSAIGVIEQFGDDLLILMGQEERVAVRIDAHTYVATRQGAARLADLAIGLTVVIAGAPQADGVILADIVVLMPGPDRRP